MTTILIIRGAAVIAASAIVCSGCNLFVVVPQTSSEDADAGAVEDATGPIDTLDAALIDGDVVRSDASRPRPDLSVFDAGTDTARDAGIDAADMTTLPDGWWDPAWPERVLFEVDGPATETLTNFPIPIELESGELVWEAALEDGSDVRFVDDATGAVLPHEISGGVAWVRLDELGPDGGRLWMYWGNPDADAVDPGPVWDEYLAVYHFDDSLIDSTGRFDGEFFDPGVAMPFSTAGRIGSGYQGSPTNSVRITSDPRFDVEVDRELTISIWFTVDATVDDTQVLVWNEARCIGWYNQIMADDAVYSTYTTGDDCSDDVRSASWVGNVVNPGQWHHFAHVIDRPSEMMHTYLDGAEIAMRTIDNQSPSGAGINLRVGMDWDDKKPFLGVADELRVAETARSAEWIGLQYRAMSGDLITLIDAP